MYAKPVMAALCVCLTMPVCANARQGGQLTVIAPDKGAISYQKWTDRATFRLSQRIRQATSFYRDGASTGYSRVQFRVGQQGRPENIALVGSSTSRGVDRISMRAVRSMGSLYPLPQEVRPGSKFEAWVIVANDARDRETMLGDLRAEHLADASAERPTILAAR